MILLVVFLACKSGKPAVPAEEAAANVTSGPADAYRGVKWGASESEAERIVRFSECKDQEPDPLLKQPRRYCTSTFKLGEVQVEDEFDFLAGRFLSGDGTFPGEDFDSVRDAFVAKYGRPQDHRSDELFWVLNGNTVLLNHLPGLGHFAIWSRELVERNQEADAEKAKEAGKAL